LLGDGLTAGLNAGHNSVTLDVTLPQCETLLSFALVFPFLARASTEADIARILDTSEI
jgi:hypothetical protein